jgi:prepilin-type N-terminal cleavage/methylation domain-containing protein
MKRFVTRNDGGFTLLELLVSLAIVSIGFMAVIPLLWNSMNVNKTTSMANIARDLAVQKVEEMMSLPRDVYDAPPYNLKTSSTYTSGVEYVTEKGEVTTDATAPFRRTFRVDNVPNTTVDPRPVVITCVVKYTYKGEERSRSFSTMWSF